MDLHVFCTWAWISGCFFLWWIFLRIRSHGIHRDFAAPFGEYVCHFFPTTLSKSKWVFLVSDFFGCFERWFFSSRNLLARCVALESLEVPD